MLPRAGHYSLANGSSACQYIDYSNLALAMSGGKDRPSGIGAALELIATLSAATHKKRSAFAADLSYTCVPERLCASHSHVLVPHGAESSRVEQILRVDNNGALEQPLDLLEIKRAELRPAGAHNQRV